MFQSGPSLQESLSYDPDLIAAVARRDPEFFAYVERVREENGSATLSLMHDTPDYQRVWACLWYALERGVMVTVVPSILKSPLPHNEQSNEQSHDEPEAESEAMSGGQERGIRPADALVIEERPVPAPDSAASYVKRTEAHRKRYSPTKDA